MKTNLLKLQTVILLLGTVFAWVTVYTDFTRFYNLYGSITRISNCVIPNPLTTPCFYGAIVFLISFFWSIKVLILHIKGIDIVVSQKNLSYLLFAGTLFAWGNFSYELYKFYNSQAAEKLSCSGIPTDNVFSTPCFVGAVIFLAALILATIIKLNRKTLRVN